MIVPFVGKFEALLKYPFKSVTDIPFAWWSYAKSAWLW